MMFAWILIVALLLLAIRTHSEINNDGNYRTETSRAAIILQERFARSEISHREYLHIQKTLNAAG